ncbi:MAG: rhodanese-like domain-containing protein [Pseudomonadota bacterium]
MSLAKVIVTSLSVISALPALAQEVWITQSLPFAQFEQDGQTLYIERNQDQAATLGGSFAKTSRACPPFCVQPMIAAPGVTTIGELELISFVRQKVSLGVGLLLDARLPQWHASGSLPGAVSVPFTDLDPQNPAASQPMLEKLGVRPLGGGIGYDFSKAQHLVVFCNGAWGDQAPQAIRNLLALGYPPELVKYYRGGMQSWLSLGFNTTLPLRS